MSIRLRLHSRGVGEDRRSSGSGIDERGEARRGGGESAPTAVAAMRLLGGQALAYGALVAGVRTAASYPGSPSSEVVETLIGLAEAHGLQVEWSSNERVSMEVAIGVSIAGRRALVCTKSVG